jgi:hypothetical protein
MKAILIDPKACTVTEVQHNGSVESIHKHIECDTDKMAAYSLPKHALYIGDLDKAKMGTFAFTIEGSNDAHFGRGLIAGFNPGTGQDIDATVTVEQVREAVRFPKVTVGRRT